ncbi:hypothetical protein [Candidatus Parabeggiatoa sp. HSG14]|uniref:hypothetical protein n=1 Tax=Candidatus Parabeggiatoa sp. HSG14 TaxID=3055593 RepID=UPI0025A72AEE|nr:hypothetical protein [Thiotrichales bacterium HSG14]
MTTQEKRLLRIALIIFVGYMLPFQLIPITYNFYSDYRQSIEKLQNNINRLEKLRKEAEYWEKRNQQAKQERDKIYAGLLSGKNKQLISADMLGLVNRIAQKAGITLKRQDTTDTSNLIGEWVLVIQSIHFEADSKTLMRFLKLVNDSSTRLVIGSLNLSTRRKKLSGSIKITAFGRISLAENAENKE